MAADELEDALGLIQHALSAGVEDVRRVTVRGFDVPALHFRVTDATGDHHVEVEPDSVLDLAQSVREASIRREEDVARPAVQRVLLLSCSGIFDEVALEIERDPQVRRITL
jgi:hypothetical protein